MTQHAADHDLFDAGSTAATFNRAHSGSLSGRGLADWQLQTVLAYIDANLSQRLLAQDLADRAGVSLSHFFRAFRVSQGSAPQAYIKARRIEQAKRVMCDSERPLCEIALDCGLYDQAHFTRVFRQLVGATPCAWRRAQRTHARRQRPDLTFAWAAQTSSGTQ